MAGELIDRPSLEKVLDEAEQWLWDYADTASLTELAEREAQLRSSVGGLCAAYLAAVEEERKSVELALEEEAKKAEAER